MRNYLRLSQILNKALIQLSMYNAMTCSVSVTRQLVTFSGYYQGLVLLSVVVVLLLTLTILHYAKVFVNTFYDFS